MNEFFEHNHSLTIVGAGGAGLRAALAARENGAEDIAVISKVKPSRSPTTCAQGGIAAALGNEVSDSPANHVEDTLRAGRGLADEKAVKTVCEEAPREIYSLQNSGVPFSRNNAGKIAQRNLAGHTANNKPARRICYFADRTGHALLQTLNDSCRNTNINFYNEFFVLDLIKEDKQIRGVVAYNLAAGSLHRFNSSAVLLATGGCGQLFNPTSNSKSSTGDGLALALDCNLPLKDMEFMQFHPTGLYKTGFLVSEAARGAGGILKNGNDERFMKDYAPDKLELAERDTVARAIFSEIKAGRGINKKNCVHLDLTAVEDLKNRLPEVLDLTTNYLGINPAKTPIAVSPTAHYLMGGIPTDLNGKVTGADAIKGLYAAGECACLSLHGANRLGGNSLLEINVMGARVGKTLAQKAADKTPTASGENLREKWKDKITALKNNNGDFTPSHIKNKLQKIMNENTGVQRTGRSLKQAQTKINTLEEKYNQIKIPDCSGHYNYVLVEALELKNLLQTAKIMVATATSREESRGAHWRADHPRTDDKKWQKHSRARIEKDRPRIDYKPA